MIGSWLFSLDLADIAVEQLAECLDPGERARASAFRHAVDRKRFVARRGQLRALLSSLIGELPDAIRFDHGANGKPRLLDHADLHFSTSSAGEVGLCVLNRGAPIGCDLALDAGVPDHLEIARRLFTEAEYRSLGAMPIDARRRGFLDLWTRKEAYLKAIGSGLDHPLDTFDVREGGGGACVVRDDFGEWRLNSLDVGPGMMAAIATRAGDDPFRGHRLPALFDPGAALAAQESGPLRRRASHTAMPHIPSPASARMLPT